LKKTGSRVALVVPDPAQTAKVNDDTKFPAVLTEDADANRPVQRFSLAGRSEALFSRGSPLNLPASVFAGATALGFLSYIMGIHNATYVQTDHLVKQVGFLWAPNWTLLFMVFLPLFFTFVTELLVFWKSQGRLKLVAQADRMESDHTWTRLVEASSYTYWSVF
jgi:hypothetical protein